MTQYHHAGCAPQPRSTGNRPIPDRTLSTPAPHRCRFELAVLALALLLTGCGGETAENQGKSLPPEDGRTIAETSAEAVEPQGLSAEAETLQAAGAQLQIDAKTGNVISVDCSSIELSDDLASKLATIEQLKKLTIRASSMTDTGWQSLAKLSQLEQLDVRDTPLSSGQLTAAVSGMNKLKALRMSGKSGSTEVDDAGLECLLNCPELKVLAADHLWVSQDGLQHLKNCQQLSELYLAGTLVDDQAMELLAQLPNLKKLRLAKTGVGTPGLETLSRLELEDLDISECSQVFDESLVAVGKMKTLKRLNLWRDVISDAGVAHLSGLVNMNWLNLDNTHMGNPGLEHLRGMSKLTFLHLGSTYVTNEGMPLLTPLTALKDLKVTRTSVTEEGLKPLLETNPSLNVQVKYIEGE
jgi:Leucine-rich repeat (LRR) protein